MGSGISLNYRGDSSYGTILGGCLSLILSLITVIFFSAQIIAWVIEAQFSQSIEKTYLRRGEDVPYKIPLKSFLPMMGVRSIPWDKTVNATYNNEEYMYH